MSLFILVFVISACQSQPDEPGVSQAITPTVTTIPTATATNTSTPSPSPSNTPTATLPPTSSQGDQLPTRILTSTPTSTAIPTDAPTPTAASILTPSATTIPLPNEVDLSTLDESLALLDRVERRDKSTSDFIGLFIYEGIVEETQICLDMYPVSSSFISTAEVFIDEDGNISGTYFGDVPVAGTRDSITGIYEHTHRTGENNCEANTTGTLQAKLTNNDQKFEGVFETMTIHSPCYYDDPDFNDPDGFVCETVDTFSLNRK